MLKKGRIVLKFSLIFSGLSLLLAVFVKHHFILSPYPPEFPLLEETAIYPPGSVSVNNSNIKLLSRATIHPPKSIRVNNFSINLPVKPARVSGNNWQLFDDAVSYLTTSGLPGNRGNVVLYAHNTNNLFGPLRWVNLGDLIELETKTATHSYQVVEKKVVPPTNIEIVNPTEDETLTLYTCTNFQDSDRLVIIAKPIHDKI